jgi:hypothetical protein
MIRTPVLQRTADNGTPKKCGNPGILRSFFGQCNGRKGEIKIPLIKYRINNRKEGLMSNRFFSDLNPDKVE